MRILKRDTDTKSLETKVKNKWRWPWLDERDSDGRQWGDWCQKIDVAGSCLCSPCSKVLSYASNGKKALRLHAEDAQHRKNVRLVKSNELLPGAEPSTPAQKACQTSIPDQVAELRSVTAAFLSEHCLPFSLAADLVEFAKRMNSHPNVLSKVSLSRTSATYINTHGVAKSFKNELTTKLTNAHFSLNLDEATNHANDKIVNILVQYYDDEVGKVVIDHFGSRKQNIATAANIFQDVQDVLDVYGFKWDQVVSVLMDNCSTMRGVRGGVETLCRNENEHLLDISGDTVHMISNAAKALFRQLDRGVEDVCSDLYYDIELSPKVSEIKQVEVKYNVLVLDYRVG